MGLGAVERVNINPLPSYAAVMKAQPLHMGGIVNISQVDEDGLFQ